MICPECGSEYREGFFQCVDCEIPLVEGTAEDLVHEPPPELELVTVMETGDPALLAFAESLLVEAQIPYTKRGEQLQDLFAFGRLGTGYNPISGPAEVQVPREHEEAAREILASASEAPPVQEEEDGE